MDNADDNQSLRLVEGTDRTVPFTDRRINVRLAGLLDVPWIMTQAPALAKFYGNRMPPLPSNSARMRPAVECLVKKHLVFIAENTKAEAVGFIGGFVTPGFFNPDLLILQETLWWVDPKARDGRAGLMLFDAFLAWGKEYTDWISITLEDNSPIRHGHLEAHGFVLKERTYFRKVAR